MAASTPGQRDSQVETWIASLNPLTQALTMVLDLIRSRPPSVNKTSLNGFYQDNGGDADLLRLNLSLDSQLYPQISGHKSRFAFVLCRWTLKTDRYRNVWISNWPVAKE
ncbi:FtsZ stabilizer [Escherichia coli]|uniref:FtsZ stabilizer n=1 Tax=Escherichia coli TaxID=562 RepID=A0A377CXA1_ECOLX|nr:FtsZ stabilizer [Escherichia coli]